MEKITLEEALLLLLNDFSLEELLKMTPELLLDLATVDGEELTNFSPTPESKADVEHLMAQIIVTTTRPYVWATDRIDASLATKRPGITCPPDDDTHES